MRGMRIHPSAAGNKKRCRKKQGSRTTRKRESRAGEAAHLVGSLHLRGLGPLAEVGGEAESPLGVLDDADDLAPSSQRLVRRVLGHDAPEVLVQVALHLDSTGIDSLPPTVPCRWRRYIARGGRTRSAAWAREVDAYGRGRDSGHCWRVHGRKVSCSGEGGAGATKEGKTGGVGTMEGGGKVLLGWLVVFRSLCLVDHPESALPVNVPGVRAGLGWAGRGLRSLILIV
jgi:hypothetical protein